MQAGGRHPDRQPEGKYAVLPRRPPGSLADFARMPPPSHLNSLTMVRLLQEWVQTDAEPARQDVAERLGCWLSAFDSVKLDSALQAIASFGAQARQGGLAVDVHALEELCRHVKNALTDLITAKAAQADDPAEPADYGQHLQRYAELQKRVESQVTACRAQVRQALSKGSPTLRQLAALDGVMAQMLGEREQKLLNAVPLYLERRFEHWRQTQQHAQVTGGWLHGFQQDMRQMLLAELQLRLQPILGLIEAVHHDNKHQA